MITIRNIVDRIRPYLGILLYDFPVVVLPAMRPSKPGAGVYPWIRIRNRGEKLVHASRGIGVKCEWKNGSDLYVTKRVPGCGRMLYNKALRDFPVRFSRTPENTDSKQPEVSFVIGHRGLDRVAGLLAVLESIAGQKECDIECIVVEHDSQERVKDLLPSWIRYIHVPAEKAHEGFSKSKTFNAGARAAKAKVLILHDGDMLVPRDYAREVARWHGEGCEFSSLKRFIFYLSKASSQSVIDQRSVDIVPEIEAISQNLPGGGSCAISREAYFGIGGFDETFAGWGGEDIEFLDRARTLNRYPYEYLPVVHLWHEPQEGKWTSKAPGFSTYNQLAGVPVTERIEVLRDRIKGEHV
jgi:hypothetical protein